MAEKPFDLLNNSLDKEVLVVIKGDVKYRGVLKGYDIHMNLVLDNAIEVKESVESKIGKILIRGDNILYLSLI